LSSLLRDQSVNARWLHRKCRQHLGRGPHEEILRVQIEQAKGLLSHTALQIEEIARQVGLSRAHFAEREQFLSPDSLSASFVIRLFKPL
jgi:transcriptional regulator GlxA family with amidase domain